MERPTFFIGKELPDNIGQWPNRQQIEHFEQPLQQIEKLVAGVFDGYLFFSPTDINEFKLSGNFPHPNPLVFANQTITAKAAWTYFTNKVHTPPDSEELPFVQYSIYRWMKENRYMGEHI